jgi:hypothetical protein
MTKEKKQKIRELMDYLLHERRLIESTGNRIDPDLRKTYKWINEKIQDLQLEFFTDQYADFEKRMEMILNAEPPFTTKETAHVV